MRIKLSTGFIPFYVTCFTLDHLRPPPPHIYNASSLSPIFYALSPEIVFLKKNYRYLILYFLVRLLFVP